MGRIWLEGQNLYRSELVGKRLHEVMRGIGLLFEEYICVDKKKGTLLVNPRIKEDVDWEIIRVLSRG